MGSIRTLWNASPRNTVSGSMADWDALVWAGTPKCNDPMEHHPEVVRHCVDTYLAYVRAIPGSIMAIEADLERLESRMLPRGITYDRMPSGSVTDIADTLQALEDRKAEWVGMVSEWNAEWVECKTLCLPMNPNRHILWLREVEWRGWTWARIVMELRQHPAQHGSIVYGERTLKAMCQAGREEMYPLMPAKWRRAVPEAI